VVRPAFEKSVHFARSSLFKHSREGILMSRLKAVTAAAAAAAVAAVAVPASASAGARLPVPYGSRALFSFAVNELFAPTAVSGGNDGCKPTPTHPFPVVLVHGTLENEGSNWVTLAPLLADHGYCVYALNYGNSGAGDIPTSARQLSRFVNLVLAETGASRVDIVGHSQGGMMPNYYIKFLGGASKVHTLIGLAPSNHGTTVDGLTDLFTIPGIRQIFSRVLDLLGLPALEQQTVGSAFETHLFAGGDTVPGPRYVVIETTHDEVVTPYTNAFLNGPNVTNITIQNQCPSDVTGHIGIVLDEPVAENVLNQLRQNPNPSFRATCNTADFGPGL
jgi:pimeloyl-ACP methyl ester carboxylesterase